MGVVGLSRNSGNGTRNELELTDESSAPCRVDSRTQVLFHPGELRLPHGAIGGKFEPISDAAKRTRMHCQMRADYRWPRTFEPRESGVRVVDAADYVAEKLSSTIHERQILAQRVKRGAIKRHGDTVAKKELRAERRVMPQPRTISARPRTRIFVCRPLSHIHLREPK